MEVKMLIENEKLKNRPELAKEHGLSIFIRYNGENILFDTGDSGAFIDNADKMGVSIEDIDTVIISHGHFDHGGGLERFFKFNSKARVFMHAQARENHYIKVLFKKIDIGIPRDIFYHYNKRISFIEDTEEISKGLFLITDITKKEPWTKFTKRMFTKKEGRFQQDDLKHEIILAINNNDKLVVFTGCSHNGVINMVNTVVDRFPAMPIEAVIGGFHLIGESKKVAEEVGQKLLQFNMDKVYTCHCTGKKAYEVLENELQGKLQYLCTGMEIEL